MYVTQMINYILLLMVYFKISAQLRTNFFVKTFTLCPSPGPVKYYGNITTENKKQYLNVRLVSPIPLDDNIGVSSKNLILNQII